MKPTRILICALVIMILFSSIGTFIHQTNIPAFSLTSPISPSTILYESAVDKPPLLNQSTRLQVYSFVEANPGVHFRGVCSGLSMSIGGSAVSSGSSHQNRVNLVLSRRTI
ncbi:hypothetical protein MUO98_04750 [Candidatus Bathyarchaeota archaeon]|nr:hypothetical protein [Candidatus Bathyarchaeota archaeon]